MRWQALEIDLYVGAGGAEEHLPIVKTHAHVHMTRAMFTLVQCFGMRDYLRKQLQRVVSSNKRRFVSLEMNLDLDLTYVCDRVIAMAMPTVKNAVHRNDIRDGNVCMHMYMYVYICMCACVCVCACACMCVCV